MKTAKVLMLLAGLMLSNSTSAISQTSTSQPTKMEIREKQIRENCLVALRTNNDGVVESVLLVVMDVKIRFPEFMLGDIPKIIDSLAASSPSASIRYKALLAAQVCESPKSFSNCRNINLEDRGSSYRMIAATVQDKLF